MTETPSPLVIMAFAFALHCVAKADVTLTDLTYSVDGSEIIITDCATIASGALNLPATIEGLPVTTLGDSAFEGCSLITSDFIPQNVTSVGEKVFPECSLLDASTVDEDQPSFHVIDGVLYSADGMELISFPAGESGRS